MFSINSITTSLLGIIIASSAIAKADTPDKIPMNCEINGYKTERAYIYETQSAHDSMVLLKLYVQLPASAAPNNPDAILTMNETILLKNADGSITQNSAQTLEGNNVKLKRTPVNEKDLAVVTLDADMKQVETVYFYQKIYNSYADLLLPLHVNKIRCAADRTK